MAFVGFLTFGFTEVVCGTKTTRLHAGSVQSGSLIVNGYAYDLSTWNHPRGGPFNGTQNPLFMQSFQAGGKDASFMFQNVNQHCLGLIKPTASSGIPHRGEQMDWYFPSVVSPVSLL